MGMAINVHEMSSYLCLLWYTKANKAIAEVQTNKISSGELAGISSYFLCCEPNVQMSGDSRHIAIIYLHCFHDRPRVRDYSVTGTCHEFKREYVENCQRSTVSM